MPDELDPKPGEEEEVAGNPTEGEAAEEAEDEADLDADAEGDDEDDGEAAEDDAEDDGEDALSDEPPARSPGRSSETIRRLRREKQDLERILRTNTSGRQSDPGEQQRQYQDQQKQLLEAARERERLGDVGAVAQFLDDKRERETNNRLQFQANQSFERDDKRDFRQLCREDNIKPALRDYVEERIETARANGNFLITREAVLNHRLGELARASARNGGNKRQQQRGESRVLRQTVKPARAASDVGGGRRRQRNPEDMSAEEFEAAFGSIPLTR